jgi:SAM-dependent methyltransferase
MGIKVKYLNFFFKSIHLGGIRPPYNGFTMCELGNQIMKYDDISLAPYIRANCGIMNERLPRTAKDFFIDIGFKHTSIDKNGKDGALPLDLCKPVPSELRGKFDVVTNFGTTEHVTNQAQVFANIYGLLRKEGVVVHIVPIKDGKLKNHGIYQYATDFFDFQIVRYGYIYILPPVERGTVPGCITVSMRKVK